MMTLFAVLLVLAIIIAIARYNENDNLFWALLVSFVGAIAAATVVVKMTNSKKQDKVVMIKEAPTQVLESVPCMYCILADTSLTATKREKSPKPVSKDTLLYQDNNILSEVFVSARGQPQYFMYMSDS